MKHFFFLIAVAVATLGCSSVRSSGNLKQTVRVSADGAEAAESAVAALKDGTVLIAWVEHGPGKDADLFVRKYSAEGAPAGESLRVNTLAGQAAAWRGDPPVISEGPDAVYIGWTARTDAPGAAGGTDFYISALRKATGAFDPPVKVNDDKLPVTHGMHSVAVDSGGRVYAAWLDERFLQSAPEQKHDSDMPSSNKPMQHAENNREVYFSISDDHGKSFSPNRKIAGDVCPCCKTALAAAPDGTVYLAWRQVVGDNFRHIAVAASNDRGANFDAPVIVSDDKWQIAGCPVSGANLVAKENGVLEVLWYSAGQAGATGLYSAQSGDRGKTFSARALVAEGSVSGTPVMRTGGRAWSSQDKIYIQPPSDDQRTVADGDLPSAAFSGGKIFISYLQKKDEHRSVWLSVINN
jgi:hypothetical protein